LISKKNKSKKKYKCKHLKLKNNYCKNKRNKRKKKLECKIKRKRISKLKNNYCKNCKCNRKLVKT